MKTICSALLLIVLCATVLSARSKTGAVAAVTAFPNPLGFPATEVGQISPIQKATFYNAGNVSLTFTYFQTPLDFQIVQNTCVATVPVGRSCDIYFVFKPTRTGSIGKYLVVYGNMAAPYYEALAGIAFE
jgi:hypothetical protein